MSQAPPEFRFWTQDQRNDWFANEAREYRDRKSRAAASPLASSIMPADGPAARAGVNLISAASVKPEPIDWLWPGFLARGKLHILAGAPGAGKTTLALRMAGIVSSGGAWPDGQYSQPGRVMIWSGEDGLADTLAPRLQASGADMSRCYFVGTVRDGRGQRPFDPAKDVPALRDAIIQAGGASLLICDPIVSAIALDSHKNSEVRRGLQPLVDLGAELNCAVLGITHFSKGTGGRDPVERITGSIAFGALPRAIFAAAREQADPDGAPSDRRLFVRAKCSNGPDGGGFAYKLAIETLEGSHPIPTSVAIFGEALAGEARSLLAVADDPASGRSGALAVAKDFLRDLLAVGPVPAIDGKQAAADAGVAGRTLVRAKEALGVSSRKSAMNGGWEWYLPEGCQQSAKAAN